MNLSRNSNFTLVAGMVFLFAIAAFGQNKPGQLAMVASVDLDRYAGKWYEIARYPNKFQKDCVANTTANYLRKDNGRIEVRNECVKKDGSTKRATGEAKVTDKATNSKLEVRFAPSFISWLPFVWGDYWIIDLDPGYQYSVVGDPGRDYFWILSRQPTMSDATYQDILRRAEAKGFQPSRVVRTPQNAEVIKGAVTVKP